MKIDRNVLTYYGDLPWRKKHFNLADIVKITFFLRLRFWRSARLLTVQVENKEYLIWVPNIHPSPVAEIRNMLSANLQERYVESDA